MQGTATFRVEGFFRPASHTGDISLTGLHSVWPSMDRQSLC